MLFLAFTAVERTGRTNKNHPPVMTMAEDSNRKRTACQAFDKISRSFQRVKAISGWLSNNGTNNNAAPIIFTQVIIMMMSRMTQKKFLQILNS